MLNLARIEHAGLKCYAYRKEWVRTLRFNTVHPAAAAVYFLSVLLITMFTSHPLILASSLIGSLLFCLVSDPGSRRPRFLVSYFVFLMLIAAANPLVSHNGASPLFFLNGNPVTSEAVLYGLNMGQMLTAALFWFRCFNLVITEDKLMFLMGRAAPKTALLFSMTLRFIPIARQKSRQIRLAQTAAGLYASDAWSDRVRGTVRVYSALITWALEHAVDVGASMRARGYGRTRRTSYLTYRLRPFDMGLIVFTALGGAAAVYAIASGRLDFSFYPVITCAAPDTAAAAAAVLFFLLAFLPFIIEMKEGLEWKYCVSKI